MEVNATVTGAGSRSKAPGRAEVLLEMRHITKQFPGVLALDDVSFSINAGEVFSIIGSNGAGKSTLMKVLSGAYPATSYGGEILINGKEVRFITPADAESAGIAMIYQEISLMLDMSIAENIFMGKLPRKKGGIVDSKKMFQQAAELLAQVGLSLNPKAMVRTLSTSQQQMLCIAKAVAQKPGILVLDEPTSTLTETEVNYLFAAIEKLKNTGVSCVYISHRLDEVFTLSDRIMIMRDGKVRGIVPKEDVDQNKIIDLMIGQQYTAFSRAKSNMDETMNVFELRDFTVKHPYVSGTNILSNVSFHLKRGEILGLIGLVGSGRSELVTSIFGYKNKARSGEIWMEGKRVNIRNPADAKRHGLGLLTEDRKNNGFVGLMNIKENITLPNLKQVSKNGIIHKPREQGRAQEYKDLLTIKANSILTNLMTLSGGNQQKVVLGKWLMTHPKVLFLDEPTRGIDVGAKYEIYKLIENLAHEGMSVLLISSEWEEIMNLCDRLIILSKGNVVADVKRKDVDEFKVNRLVVGLE